MAGMFLDELFGRAIDEGDGVLGDVLLDEPVSDLAEPVGKRKQAPPQDPDELAALIADILGGLLGEDALRAFEPESHQHAEGGARTAWTESLHPRGKGGRFILRGSVEAVATAHDALGKLRAGDRHPDAIRDALKHLSILTVKQLHAFKRLHGLKASGRLRAELIQKIAERLPGHGKPAVTSDPKPEALVPAPSRAEALKAHLRATAALHATENLQPEGHERLKHLEQAIAGHEAALPPADVQKVYDEMQMSGSGPLQRQALAPPPSARTPRKPRTARQLTPEQEQEVERRTQELMGRAKAAAGPAPAVPQPAPPLAAPTAPVAPLAPRPAGLPSWASATGEPTPAPSVKSPALDAVPAADVEALVRATHKAGGKYNQATLADVRDALPPTWSREHQDNVIQRARRDGLIAGEAPEGRHGITLREIAAHLTEGDRGVGLLSLHPAGQALAQKPAEKR